MQIKSDCIPTVGFWQHCSRLNRPAQRGNAFVRSETCLALLSSCLYNLYTLMHCFVLTILQLFVYKQSPWDALSSFINTSSKSWKMPERPLDTEIICANDWRSESAKRRNHMTGSTHCADQCGRSVLHTLKTAESNAGEDEGPAYITLAMHVERSDWLQGLTHLSTITHHGPIQSRVRIASAQYDCLFNCIVAQRSS